MQVGGAIFLAVVTVVVTASASDDASPQAVLDSYRTGLIVVTAIAGLGLLITATGLRTRRAPQQTVLVAKSESESVQEEQKEREERYRSATGPLASHSHPSTQLRAPGGLFLPAGRSAVKLRPMGNSGGRRTQAERDAMTVEIGYALASAAVAAALVFGALSGPALLFDLPPGAEDLLLMAGTGLAVIVFFVRVVSVLVRFGRPQPSQPGRTKPDS